MDFSGTPTALTQADFDRAATTLDCSPAAVAAVSTVETSGAGFLADTRPKILFEAATFSRLTGGKYDQSHPNISSHTWNRALYGAGGAHQYDRLAEALALDEVAALKSASWGRFQIMGENCTRCGFADVHAFVEAMKKGEGAHLDAFAAFVKNNSRMLAALQGQDWATFARLYNGPGYAQNHYDTKLAAAFADHGGTATV